MPKSRNRKNQKKKSNQRTLELRNKKRKMQEEFIKAIQNAQQNLEQDPASEENINVGVDENIDTDVDI